MSLQAYPSLVEILKDHQDDIVAIWGVMLHELPNSHYNQVSMDTLTRQLRNDLKNITNYLDTGHNEILDAFLSSLSQERFNMGFRLQDVMQGILIAKEAILPIIWKAYPPGSYEKHDAIATLDGILRRMVGRFSELYNNEFFASSQKQQRRTAMMLESIQNAGSSLELPQVMSRVANALTRTLNATNCFIYLADKSHSSFIPFICANPLPEEMQEKFTNTSLSTTADPLVYQVVQQNKPVICYNVPADSRIRAETPMLMMEHSLMVIPIGLGKRILGIAFATLSQTHPIDPGDIQLAFGIANAVALAIDNARLYEETLNRLSESQSLHQISLALLEKRALNDVFEIACAEAQKLTDAKGSGVAFVGEDSETLNIVFQTGVSWSHDCVIDMVNNPLGLAVHEDRPVLISRPAEDGSSPTALLAVPLKIKGEIIGVLNLVEKAGGFTPEDQRILTLFADQAALAIDHARMLDRIQEAAVAEERHRLARDLHDSVTQSLYGVTLYAEAANRQMLAGNINAATRNLQNLRLTAHESLRDMRLLIFELLPPTLSRDGLVAALKRRLKSVEERAGIETELLAEINERLPADVEEHLYSMAIETLNNALKYSQAKKVTIGLLKPGDTLVMRISDDGIGFNIKEAEAAGGMGMDNLKERAGRIHALLDIQSEPGKGTSTTVTVEMKK